MTPSDRLHCHMTCCSVNCGNDALIASAALLYHAYLERMFHGDITANDRFWLSWSFSLFERQFCTTKCHYRCVSVTMTCSSYCKAALCVATLPNCFTWTTERVMTVLVQKCLMHSGGVCLNCDFVSNAVVVVSAAFLWILWPKHPEQSCLLSTSLCSLTICIAAYMDYDK